MLTLAELGWALEDLSPSNVLFDGDQVVIIDGPQVVDVIGNPHGSDYLERDRRIMCDWATQRGRPLAVGLLVGELVAATSRWAPRRLSRNVAASPRVHRSG